MATTKKTPKAQVRTEDDGSKVYGPYKGSKQNKGRPVSPRVRPGQTDADTSSNSARDKKDPKRKLPQSKHVAHKPGTSRSATSTKSTTVQDGSKNIADGNRARRKGK